MGSFTKGEHDPLQTTVLAGCVFTPMALPRRYVGPKATPPNIGSKLLVLDTERLEEACKTAMAFIVKRNQRY